MPITDILERNCKLYGNDICLVEINPEIKETRRVTWKEYELMEPNPVTHYRREITWSVFNEKANRFANLLLERGIKKGDKVAVLLMNCLEWLPIYFGILKTGPLAVLPESRRGRCAGVWTGIYRACGGDRGEHQQKPLVILCGRQLSKLCGGLQQPDGELLEPDADDCPHRR